MTAVQVSKDSPILEVIRHASENYQTVIMAFTEDDNLYTPQSFYTVALECAVGSPIFADANNVIFLFQARRRVKLLKLWLNSDDVVFGTVEMVKEKTSQAKTTLALHRSVYKAVESWQYLSGTSTPDLVSLVSDIRQSGVLADAIATAVDLNDQQRLEVLQETDGLVRLRMVYAMLIQENELIDLKTPSRIRYRANWTDHKGKPSCGRRSPSSRKN